MNYIMIKRQASEPDSAVGAAKLLGPSSSMLLRFGGAEVSTTYYYYEGRVHLVWKSFDVLSTLTSYIDGFQITKT